MHDFKKGREYFGAATNFDYYVLVNVNSNRNMTLIHDIDDQLWEINLEHWEFIPSGRFDFFEKIIAKRNEEKTNIMYSSSLYHNMKKWMSKTPDKTHIYPCCYTITIKDGMKYRYSSVQHGHFGVPKVIWSNGVGTYPIIDINGDYGLTEFSYAIVDKVDNLLHIKDALNHPDLIKLMTYVKFTNNKYNYKIISLFKKDFWKYFVTPKSVHQKSTHLPRGRYKKYSS